LFNRLSAARKGAFVDIAHDNLIARRCGYLRDAMAHRARAKHTYAPDWASRSHVVVLVRVFTQLILGRTDKVDVDQGHNLAGACLVRLTRTPIVILYAQPKTPIVSCDCH